MPQSISLIEPHPSVPSTYNTTSTRSTKPMRLSTGRGGAGNFTKHSPTSLTPGPTASGPASRTSLFSRNSSSSHHSAFTTASSSSSASASAASTTRQAPPVMLSGRGGAGNARPASERRIFSFDEELEHERMLAEASARSPVFHVGRGGIGNAFVQGRPEERKARTSSNSSVKSDDSQSSVVGRMGRGFARAFSARSVSKE